MEATLKAALCLAALERRDEAREHFSKLHGTSFEPFALAEQAEMEISGDPAGTDPERCVELCRQLFDKHKHSQASVRIFDIANRNQSFRVYVCTAKNYTRELELLEELTGLAVRSCTCRSKSHMRCLARLIALQCSQGLYKKALEEFKVELDQLSEAQRRNAFVQNCLAELDLANGGFYCPADITTMSGVPWQQRWVIFHCAVRSNQIDRLMHDFVPQDPLLMMAAHLCLGNTEEADKYLRKACQPEIKASLLTNTIYYLDAGWRVAESRQPQLLESYLKFPPSDHKHCQTAARFVQARWALESLDFEQAAKLILDIEPELGFEEGRRYILLQIMTSTLCGRMNTPEHARLRKRCDQTLSGTMLDLARIFCKEKEPRPGELWPDASWCPEWRLWLGLSLEAQGKKSEAREIVLQSLDPRYGLTHCQPAIRALLDRCPSE
jgi:tetratricopeptide (TPR) repeat protein